MLKTFFLNIIKYVYFFFFKKEKKNIGMDISERILFCAFNLLNKFVDKEFNKYNVPTEDECIKDPDLRDKRLAYFEIIHLHNWWIGDRLLELKAIEDYEMRWHYASYDLKVNPKIDRFITNEKILRDKLIKLQYDFDKKTEEMLFRLIKIRKFLK